MELFGKNISIRSRGCLLMDNLYEPMTANVNLFVKVTNGCNARCAFCSNGKNRACCHSFDHSKLNSIIQEIRDKGIKIKSLNITGGEPSLVPGTVLRILDDCSEGKASYIPVHLNTNGLSHEARKLMVHPRLSSVSLSLHHYDRVKLEEIYGCEIREDFFDFSDIDIERTTFSCNLIKGYINNPTEARKMMDFAIDKGFREMGFVALMNVNRYCTDKHVPLGDLNLQSISGVNRSKWRSNGDFCRCENFIYEKEGHLLSIYMRHIQDPTYCESSLLFDGQYLRQGFDNDNIII